MTNQLSIVVGVVAGVVVGVVAGVVAGVIVELRLRLWKLDAVDDVKVQRLITHKYRGSQQFLRVEYSTQIY